MGKKPITSAQVRTLRNNVKNKPLQELLLNLGVDLMLRSSDLLNLKVSDVLSESGDSVERISKGNAPNLTTESRFHLPENTHKEIL